MFALEAPRSLKECLNMLNHGL